MNFYFRRLLCALAAACLCMLPLAAGAEGTELRTVQERLLALGYEIGPADGILGEKTTAAVLLAQTLLAEQGFNVTPTGIPDKTTADLIAREENASLLRTLLKGSRGTRVKEAQQKLINLNLLRDSADGKYGANTEAAVTALEKHMA